MDEFIPLHLFGERKSEEDVDVVIAETIEVKAEEIEKEDLNTSQIPLQKESNEEDVLEDLDKEERANNDKNEDLSTSEIPLQRESNEENFSRSSEDVCEENDAELQKEQNKIDKILESQQQLIEQVESLNKLFTARIMHTNHEEKIVDQMHRELQKYKEDMYAKLVRPILLDVIDVRDSIMRMSATYSAKPEGEQSIPNKMFADYALDLQDILEKNNVEIYRSKKGDNFIPVKQRVVKKIVTSDEALHGKVAKSLSSGYSYNGKTISAEKIMVYFYEKTIEKNEDSEVIENG